MKWKLVRLFIGFLIYRTKASVTFNVSPTLPRFPWQRKQKDHRKTVKLVLAISAFIVAFVTLAIAAVSWFVAAKAIRPADYEVDDEEHTLDFYPWAPETVSLIASDGVQINAWWLPGTRSEAVAVIHGYSTSPYSMLPNINVLHDVGYHVIAPWLRSAPAGDGEPTTFGVYEQLDVMAAVDFARTQDSVDMTKVAVLGTSMGAATAIIAGANDRDIAAVVAEAPYKNVAGIVGRTFEFFTHLPAYPFGPLAVFFGGKMLGVDVKHISPLHDAASISPRPLMLIAGTNDEIIPYTSSVEIFANAGESRELWIVPGAGHGQAFMTEPDEYRKRVLGFLDDAFSGIVDAELE